MMKYVALVETKVDSQRLVCAYTSRGFGSLSTRTDSAEVVNQRYQTLADHLKVEVGSLFCLPQTHSTNIVILRDRRLLERPEGPRRYRFTTNELVPGKLAITSTGMEAEWQRGIDGVILAVDGLFPVILTADCAPVMFWSPTSKVCGIAHVGLVGAVNQLAAQMVSLMNGEMGVAVDTLRVAILPSIRGCHYELARSGTWQRIKGEVGRLYGEGNPLYQDGFFRLPEFIRWQLDHAGVLSENIQDLGVCTVCQATNYFSHVQAGFSGQQTTEGRFGSVVGMRTA